MPTKNLSVLLLSLLFACAVLPSSAQNGNEAKTILDGLSKKNKAFKTIKATFSIASETKDHKKETQDGLILIKGNKYKLTLKGQEFYNNGTYIWNYVISAKETTKDWTPKPDEKNKQKKVLDISKLFTLYENGYKYKYDKEITEDGALLQVIDLYPTKPDEQSFHTVKLFINKAKNQIQMVKFMNKDQTYQLITVKTLQTDLDMAEDVFSYDPAAHPGIRVEDMTKD